MLVTVGDNSLIQVEIPQNSKSVVIKPLQQSGETNLFVFTDYDRFNFQLVVGTPREADFSLRIRRSGIAPAVESGREGTTADTQTSKLSRRAIRRRATCSGLTLTVQTIGWPESRSVLLIEFRAEISPRVTGRMPLFFEPGDLGIRQAGRALPIESLHLTRLKFEARPGSVDGTLVLRQAEFNPRIPLALSFTPDFLKPYQADCPNVSFIPSGPPSKVVQSARPSRN